MWGMLVRMADTNLEDLKMADIEQAMKMCYTPSGIFA